MNQPENDNSTTAKNEPSSPNNDCSNSSSCSSKNNVPPKPSYGRYCHIIKRPDFDGYGFNLHSEKIKPGQYIGKVDANSPAEAAGLREGDQIIEVNGVNIGIETHKQVVQRIKAISNEVRLLLIDPSTDGVSANTKSQINIPEKTVVNNKRSINATTNQKSPTTMPITKPNSPPIMPATELVTAEEPDQKEYITSISMVSTKHQTSYSSNPTADVTDSAKSTTNGHHAKANGQTIELTTTTTIAATPDHTETTQQQPNANSSQTNVTNKKTGLNLNLTAAEMRAKLLAKKKFDPKNESVDLKKKFDIIQKL